MNNIINLIDIKKQKEHLYQQSKEDLISSVVNRHFSELMTELQNKHLVREAKSIIESDELIVDIAWVMALCKAIVYKESKIEHPMESFFSLIKQLFENILMERKKEK